MDESNRTAGSKTSVASGGPALAYVNPQPKLPGSEAAPPEQPETFMRRARRVRLGSCRLKLWYLALCTFGRAWGREDVLEIGIKQAALAGELETVRKRVVRMLAELRAAGVVHVSRSQHHSVIRIYLVPQRWIRENRGSPETVSEGDRDDPQEGSTGKRDDPQRGSTGKRDDPQRGSTGKRDDPQRGSTGKRDDPQEGSTGKRDDPQEGSTGKRDDPQRGSTGKRDDPQEGSTGRGDPPETGATAVRSDLSGTRTYVPDPQQQHPERARAREASEKQLTGIASMAAELGIPSPESADGLAADVVFRELRERVDAQRSAARGPVAVPASTPGRRRHRIVAALNAGGKCEVCGEHRPNPKGTCPGAR